MKMKKKSAVLIVVLVIMLLSLTTACNGQNHDQNQIQIQDQDSQTQNEQIQESDLVKALKDRVNYIAVNLFDSEGNWYHANAWLKADRTAELEIFDPETGEKGKAYHLEVIAQECDENRCIRRFDDYQEIIIKPGENNIVVNLKLYNVQSIEIDVSGVLASSTTDIKITVKGPDGVDREVGYGILWNKDIIYTYISLDTEEISLYIEGNKYVFPENELIIRAIMDNIPLPLGEPVTITILQAEVNFLEDYATVPGDFQTIQEAIDNVPAGTTIVIDGIFRESFTVTKDIKILGNPTWPQEAIIESEHQFVISVQENISLSLSGIIVKSFFIGQRQWDTAAVLVNPGATLTMDHCVVISYGSAHPISVNYSQGSITNTTILRYGSNPIEDNGTYGIGLYNDSAFELDYLLISNFYKAIHTDNEPAVVENSVFWDIIDVGNIVLSTSNASGETDFFQIWRFAPNIYSESIQYILNQGNGNYPGASMPMKSWN